MHTVSSTPSASLPHSSRGLRSTLRSALPYVWARTVAACSATSSSPVVAEVWIISMLGAAASCSSCALVPTYGSLDREGPHCWVADGAAARPETFKRVNRVKYRHPHPAPRSCFRRCMNTWTCVCPCATADRASLCATTRESSPSMLRGCRPRQNDADPARGVLKASTFVSPGLNQPRTPPRNRQQLTAYM